MLKIHTLSSKDFSTCYELLNINSNDLYYFNSLGWNFNEFKKQFFKDINFGIGLYNNHKLESFIIGNLINIKNILEYEILVVYVKNKKRKQGYATRILKNIELTLKKKHLKKMYLEVAIDNQHAIKLYKKNGFNQVGLRKHYYKLQNKKIDAYLFEKIINE